MKYFAVLTTYVPDAVERRKPFRDAHLAFNKDLKAAGRLALAGAFADPVDQALIVHKAESKEEVWARLAQDPYLKAGIWNTVTVREWSVVIE